MVFIKSVCLRQSLVGIPCRRRTRALGNGVSRELHGGDGTLEQHGNRDGRVDVGTRDTAQEEDDERKSAADDEGIASHED